MVVFTCGHCGESVQKPKVEKHYMTKCRNRNANLSCMDCFKDFFGKDYESHTKCVTEEQRYSGKGFVAKEKKGEQKQTAWVDLVQSVLQEQTNATKNVLRIIESVSKHTNTPRKKPKFINFVKNVCGHKTNANDIEVAWNMISVKLTELSLTNQSKNKKNDSQDLNNSSNSNDKTVEDNNESITEDPENKIEEEKVETKTKKELKEEKKRKRYEEQLNSIAKAPEEIEEAPKATKKEKKLKNKTNEVEGDTEGVQEQTNNKKNKKRKRIDTVNEVNGASEENKNGQVVEPTTTKPDKKKQREQDGISLHDQNVAATEELDINKGSFNWHATILSVLQKKGNEIPFKRLQKKVLGEYSECTGCVADDRIADKFIKKLKSAPKVKVNKNTVYLED